ncbi:hypothetical protein JADG_010435 [Aureobasidium aubasidani]|nr:hypothetical protein JADG_010435 [Aureobasidium pullulans]
MPVANPQGFFHQEAPLEFDDITDLQEIETGDADLAFMRKYEYKGVLLVEILGRPNTTSTTGAVKRQRVEFRAVVLGESQLKPGEMILLYRPGKIFQTVYGMELKQKGGITTGNVHWCSGLQIKWVPSITASTKTSSASYSEKVIQKARVGLAKELYSMIENEDLDWEDIDWDEVEVMFSQVPSYSVSGLLGISSISFTSFLQGIAIHINKEGLFKTTKLGSHKETRCGSPIWYARD